MAILLRWKGPHDGVCHRGPRAHDGLRDRRRRVRAKDAATLCGKHRDHRPEVPGDVQEQQLSRFGAFGVALAHAAGAGGRAFTSGQSHAGHDAERQTFDHAWMTGLVTRASDCFASPQWSDKLERLIRSNFSKEAGKKMAL